MPILSPNVGERVAGLQVLPGTLSRPGLACQLDEDTGFDWLTGGLVRYVSDGVETARFTADGISLPLFSSGSVLFTGASGRLSEDAGLTYAAATDLLTVVGGVITAAVGPTAAQQHTLPAVTSDTIALLAASQILTNKTFNLTSNTLVATSAQLITAVTDETGTGALVFATSPTLVTPLLGTPTSGILTNCTGLPAAAVVAGTFGAGNFIFPADLTIGDQLVVSGVGPHAIGGVTNADRAFSFIGTFAGAGAPVGFYEGHTLTLSAGGEGYGFEINPTLTEAGSGNHPFLSGIRIRPRVTAGAATATLFADLYIDADGSAATGTTNRVAIHIANLPGGATNNAIFGLPADATDPTGGGGAAAGRIPCVIGGAIKYLAYY